MAYDLFTPILNARTRAPHFFNGRLLTGEAMTDEHRAQTVARELLAQSVGEGVAWGLEVEQVATSPIERPSVRIKSGVAVNRRGEILLLSDDIEVQLVRPPDEVPNPDKLFQTCVPITTNAQYVADPRVYLLTITSVRAGNGLAAVTGLGDTPRGCNIKYVVDAVAFRLLELPLDDATLADRDHLRNVVAYKCFGVDDPFDVANSVFDDIPPPQTPLAALRDNDELTDCDVPLALFYWTATSGIVWLDLWSVRRRITRTRTADSFFDNDPRVAITEAIVEQFAAHVDDLNVAGDLQSATIATQYFRYLPPVGSLPIASSLEVGVIPQQFFLGHALHDPVFIAADSLRHLLNLARRFPPIRLSSDEVIFLYLVVENVNAANTFSLSLRPPVQFIFAHPRIDYLANARFDLARWNYSNYALV
jgi:hypothetical protein